MGELFIPGIQQPRLAGGVGSSTATALVTVESLDLERPEERLDSLGPSGEGD